MPSSEAHHHTAQMVGVGARELKIVTQGASMGGVQSLESCTPKACTPRLPGQSQICFHRGGAPLSGITFMFLWDLLAEPWEAFGYMPGAVPGPNMTILIMCFQASCLS